MLSVLYSNAGNIREQMHQPATLHDRGHLAAGEYAVLIRCHSSKAACKCKMLHALFVALPASPYSRGFQVSFRPVKHGYNILFAWCCFVP
jgi:hypothetical protein